MLMIKRTAFGIFCASTVLTGAQATTLDNAIVITEFFEDFQLIDPSGPSATPLFVANPGNARIPGQMLIEPVGTILYNTFSEIRRYDPQTGLITLLAEPGLSLQGIAFANDGSVIATDSNEVFRIDPSTGVFTTITPDEMFFVPRAVTVTPDGTIYVNEFFEDLYSIDPDTLAYSIIVTDIDMGIARTIEALPSGDLVVVNSDDNVYILDPGTGTSTLVTLDTDLVIGGTAIGTNGQFLATAGDGVYEIDLATGATTLLFEDDSFFSPADIAQGTITIPEPSSLALLLAGVGLVARRRRG